MYLNLERTSLVAPKVVVLESAESTMDEARKLVEAGQIAEHGLTVVAADEQTAGKGRADHRWVSQAGKSLTMSVVARMPKAVVGNDQESGWLPIIADMALLDALRETVRESGIQWAPVKTDQHASNKNAASGLVMKWPNDIVYDGQKLGGVLVEMVPIPHDSEHMAVIFGVGVNIAVDDAKLPLGAASLADVTKNNGPTFGFADISDHIAVAFVRSLERRVLAFSCEPYLQVVAIADEMSGEIATLGERVEITYVSGNKVAGEAVAIDQNGSLVVTDHDGIEHLVRTSDLAILQD